MRAIRVEAAAVALRIVDEFALRDEVDDVEAEALDALFLPEAQDGLELLAHFRILPVKVGLRDVEEVQVPLAELGHVLPGRAAELRLPVRRRRVRCSVAEDVVLHVLRIALQRFLEPLVRRRGVVEDHVEHQADAVRRSLRNQRLEVFHRAEARGDRAIVGDVVAIIALRRREERREPQEIDAEFSEVVESVPDAVEIAPAIAVRILERLRVNLIDDFICNIHLSFPFLLSADLFKHLSYIPVILRMFKQVNPFINLFIFILIVLPYTIIF